MRIVVNNIAASSGGALSILENLYDYIINSDDEKENEWIFLLNGNYIKETKNIKVIVVNQGKKSWLKRLYFDLLKGRKYISKFNPDVVFSLQNTISFGLKVPQVLYMHQAIPFQNKKNFSFFKKSERIFAIYQHIIGRLIIKSIKEADYTIVQTNWIKEAVIRKCGISSSKISAVVPTIKTDSSEKHSPLEVIYDRESFFYPAANSIYKNHDCIFRAAEILKNRGVKNFNIDLTINENTPKENISFLNELPFTKVKEHYQKSTLIFPSYIETLGLPLIEAKGMNSIILASDTPFSLEILKDYENAYFFDPFSAEELANLMHSIISGRIVKKDASLGELKENNTWKKVCEIIKSEV